MAKDEGEFKVEDEEEDKKDSREDEHDRKPPKPRPAPPPDDDYYRDRDRDGPPPPGYGPAPTPMFSAEKLPKLLAIFILIGIIILFIGALLTSSAGFIKVEGDDAEDDRDLKRNLTAGGHLMGGIGLLLTGLFIVLPLMIIKDLSDNQRILLGILLMAVILGFSLLINKTLAF